MRERLSITDTELKEKLKHLILELQRSFPMVALQTIVLCAGFLAAKSFMQFTITPEMLIFSTVKGHSMNPTLEEEEVLLLDKISHDFRTGDIVVFHGDTQILVKRVIATGDQTVEMINGQFIVDGVMLSEPYAVLLPDNSEFNYRKFIVPLGSILYIGDNRPETIGGITSDDKIIGEAIGVIWSDDLDRIGTFPKYK